MRTRTWVLGYHGCDQEVGEAVLSGKRVLRASDNDWDWLGTGIYLWENSAKRASDWAIYAHENPRVVRSKIKEPFVIGAIVDLGNCLDLLEAASIRVVEESYHELRQIFEAAESPMPVNSGTPPDRVMRRLDCAVINYVHDTRERGGEPAFDSVRAVFVEGERLYEKAGFHSRSHIQLCIRSEAQIIGYFRVRELED